MNHFTLAVDPTNMGSLHAFSIGTIDEMLKLTSVYFELEELYGIQSLNTVMIRYD